MQVSEPCCSTSTSSAQSILTKISAPTCLEVTELAGNFPVFAKKPAFNPTAVVSRKKRPQRKPKASNVTVVLLQKFEALIPRGGVRRKLAEEGRIQTVRLHKEMSDLEVRGKIAACFKCSKEFTALDVDGQSTLCKRSDQSIDGAAVVTRTLYLCEMFEVQYQSLLFYYY